MTTSLVMYSILTMIYCILFSSVTLIFDPSTANSCYLPSGWSYTKYWSMIVNSSILFSLMYFKELYWTVSNNFMSSMSASSLFPNKYLKRRGLRHKFNGILSQIAFAKKTPRNSNISTLLGIFALSSFIK